MSLQTLPAVGALPGPPWLAARRQAALDRVLASGMPTTEEEIWRYSRIDAFDLDAFRLDAAADAAPGPVELPGEVTTILEAIGERAGLVVIRNGRAVTVELAEGPAGPGVTITDLTAATTAAADATEPAGLFDDEPADVFDDLNLAYGAAFLRVEVPRGVTVEPPLVVIHWIDEPGVAVFPRLVIDAGEGAQLSVVEYVASADVAALAAPVIKVNAAQAAIVRLATVQTLGPQVWQIGYQNSVTGRGTATVASATVALGGSYVRSRIEAQVVGDGSTADLVAVYFSDGDQMHDFRTLQDHHGKKSSSDLLFKGAVAGTAHAVYTGLIRVNPGAAGTDAFLTNRNVVLSADARVDSVPNLDIVHESDLRQCGHASASGPIDEEQRFYLESRGIPTHVAERLIVLGFFDDTLARLPVGLRPLVRVAVANKLQGVTA